MIHGSIAPNGNPGASGGSRSFARAAQLLQIDPSAVSHAIAELEKELRVMLFYRTTRQLSLTEDGEEIFHRAREILSQIAELDAIAHKPRESLHGTLRLGMTVPISRTVISPAADVHAASSALHVECLVLSQVKEMHAGGLDLMLRAGTPPESGLIARKIADIHFGVYAAPAYLEVAGEPRDPDQLRASLFRPQASRGPARFGRMGIRASRRPPSYQGAAFARYR